MARGIRIRENLCREIREKVFDPRKNSVQSATKIGNSGSAKYACEKRYHGSEVDGAW